MLKLIFLDDQLTEAVMKESEYLRLNNMNKDLMNEFLQDEYVLRAAMCLNDGCVVVKELNDILADLTGSALLSTTLEDEQNPLAASSSMKRTREVPEEPQADGKCHKSIGIAYVPDEESSMDSLYDPKLLRTVNSVPATDNSPRGKRPSLTSRNLSAAIQKEISNPSAHSVNESPKITDQYLSFLRDLFTPSRLAVVFDYMHSVASKRDEKFFKWPKYFGSIAKKATTAIVKSEIDDWYFIHCISPQENFHWISCDKFVGYRQLNHHCYLDFLLELGIKPRKFYSQLYYDLRDNSNQATIFTDCYRTGTISLMILLNTLKRLWTPENYFSRNKKIVIFKRLGSLDGSIRKLTLCGYDEKICPRNALETWWEVRDTIIVQSSCQVDTLDECTIHGDAVNSS